MARRPLIYISTPISTLIHGNSLNLDGIIEDIRNTTENDIGIGDSWTLSIWWKPVSTTYAVIPYIFNKSPIADNAYAIEVIIAGTVANDPLQINLRDNLGSNRKTYRWNSFVDTTNWMHLCVTWDGTSLLVYKNGVEVAPSTKVTDLTLTMVNTNSYISLGCNKSGAQNMAANFHSFAIWDTALGSSAITALYNGGSGSTYDVTQQSLANLKHWWLLGFASGDLFHNDISSLNIGENQANLDDTDIEASAP